MKQYLLAHDLGTSGNKAVLYDIDGNLIASAFVKYPTYYPQAGYVEQDAEDWWKAVCVATKRLLAQTDCVPSQIMAISFSGQMMGCLLVDHEGNPLYRMITWADIRSSRQAEEMKNILNIRDFYYTVGHRISASYSAAKLLWLREIYPQVYRNAYKMLNAKDYIVYKLTGNFVTDYSDASGTNLLDINNLNWSDDIIKALNLRADLLPELHASSDVVGYVTSSAAKECGLIAGVPVVAGGGDGVCACVGAGVTSEGKTYCSLGSSSWISTVTKAPVFDVEMRTFNWVHLDPSLYTPCGTMQTAGYSLKWISDTICDYEKESALSQNISIYQIIDKLIATSPIGANKLLFLPYLLGERCPLWDTDVRGAFIGLSITHTKADLLRAVLEGVGYNLNTILNILEQYCKIKEIIMIGGGAQSNVWMQILANIFGKMLLVPQYIEEATSVGAAICAGVGIGAFESFDVVSQFNKISRTVFPQMEYHQLYDEMLKAFHAAYEGLQETHKLLAEIPHDMS